MVWLHVLRDTDVGVSGCRPRYGDRVDVAVDVDPGLGIGVVRGSRCGADVDGGTDSIQIWKERSI